MTNVQNGVRMEFWNRQVKGETWSKMWPEIVEAGKDQTVNPQFVAEIGRRIAAGR